MLHSCKFALLASKMDPITLDPINSNFLAFYYFLQIFFTNRFSEQSQQICKRNVEEAEVGPSYHFSYGTRKIEFDWNFGKNLRLEEQKYKQRE